MVGRKDVDLDDLIVRILSVGQPGQQLVKVVKEHELIALCQLARDVFLQQPSLIEINPPVRLCGDTHGQYPDLLRLFDRGGFPPLYNYMFLGDYVDRGHQNLENVGLLFAYKCRYPGNFFLLRGNHECQTIKRVYGFYEECTRRYQSVGLYNQFQETFNAMPLVGLIGNRILCMHGGLSPKLKSLEQLRQITRPMEPPNPSLHLDLLWADPEMSVKGWEANSRGVSYVFAQDVVHTFASGHMPGARHRPDRLVRAHQVVQDGYEFFANRKLVTIFSAPHYCGQFDNAAVIMMVDENLGCQFNLLRAVAKKKVKRK